MESGPQNQNRNGLLGPYSIMVVYVDPLGFQRFNQIFGVARAEELPLVTLVFVFRLWR